MSTSTAIYKSYDLVRKWKLEFWRGWWRLSQYRIRTVSGHRGWERSEYSFRTFDEAVKHMDEVAEKNRRTRTAVVYLER